MGVYEDRILPRLIDVALNGREFRDARRRVTSGLSGDVLEVGFGSGRNLEHLPSAVARLMAVEPSPGGRRLARERIDAAPVPVDFVGLDGAALGLDDASVDHVLVTWTLCTIPDVVGALGEIRRVLRPGGALHFVEHGRSPDARVARWQDRLTPIQRRVAGGCHLNRAIPDLVAGSGLELTRLDTFDVKGPRPFGHMFEGVATRVA